MHAAGVEALDLGEVADLGFERIQGGALVVAGVDQHRHEVT